jgi:ABC-2 type transport system permease protein
MKKFFSFVIKESKHILRDRRTLLILFGMPVVMILLFGFAISNDVRNVRTVVVTASMDNTTRPLVEALSASPYFDITKTVTSTAAAEKLMRDQKADLILAFSPQFGDRIPDRSSSVQLIADGSDPNMAQQYVSYAKQIITQHLVHNLGMQSPTLVSTKLLFNPQMKSAYNFVPGIMAMLLFLICAMMTSISIVREKERGTMEVLLVSPMRPIMIIISKAVPYLFLALFILTTILLLSRYVLMVPLSGSLLWIYFISLIYILLGLCLGLLISTIAKTQLVALLMSAMMLLMPCLMLSGMLFPVESMPKILQWISLVMPPRYYVSAMRKLMIMGVGLSQVMHELTILTIMTVVLLFTAIANFKTRLE